MKKLLLAGVVLVSACSFDGGNVLDRAPDYRKSRVLNRLEVPPNLVALDNQGLVIPNEGASTYNTQKTEIVHVNEVLPELYKVDIHGATISVSADVENVWKYVKQFWHVNGINLVEEQPHLGLMVTDWLEDKNKLPKSMFSQLLNSVGVLDSGERDRYRVQFSRVGNGTQISVSHVLMEEKEDVKSTRTETGTFKWVESNKGNQQLAEYMAKRIGLYVSQQIKRAK